LEKYFFYGKNDKKLWKPIKKITEHPVEKGNSFLSVFLPGESIQKKTKKSKLLQFCSARI
jgi:hypothetical protein